MRSEILKPRSMTRCRRSPTCTWTRTSGVHPRRASRACQMNDAMGLRETVCATHFGTMTPEESEASMRLLAEEVMPVARTSADTHPGGRAPRIRLAVGPRPDHLEASPKHIVEVEGAVPGSARTGAPRSRSHEPRSGCRTSAPSFSAPWPSTRRHVRPRGDQESDGGERPGRVKPRGWSDCRSHDPGGVLARGLAVRIYRATQPVASPSPGVVYFHGGGWAAGGFDTHDEFVGVSTAATGFTFVAVDYRLGARAPLPCRGRRRCRAATVWVSAQADVLGNRRPPPRGRGRQRRRGPRGRRRAHRGCDGAARRSVPGAAAPSVDMDTVRWPSMREAIRKREQAAKKKKKTYCWGGPDQAHRLPGERGEGRLRARLHRGAAGRGDGDRPRRAGRRVHAEVVLSEVSRDGGEGVLNRQELDFRRGRSAIEPSPSAWSRSARTTASTGSTSTTSRAAATSRTRAATG